MTYRQLYEYGAERLAAAGIEEAQLDARLLLEYVCHTDRQELLVHGDSIRNQAEETCYRVMIEQREKRIPLQYITGEQDFMGLTFHVNEHTLIPRQDTEILVEEALLRLWDGMRILDLCTGSGCILLSLLHYSNECEGTGADLSGEALAVARENAQRLGIKANFIQSDLLEQVTGTFDMLISNPPYIETAVIPTLMPEVRDHEPMLALDGREDGLYFYRRIAKEAPQYLAEGGWLLFEIGCEQAQAVSALMKEQGFDEIKVVKDYAGLDRVVAGQKRNEVKHV